MIKYRVFIASLLVGFVLVGSANAAINLTFGDAFMQTFTVQGTSSAFTTGDIDEITTGPSYSDFGTVGYDVGFRGDINVVGGPDSFGTLFIGESVAFSTGADTFLKAEFSNDNDDTWDFGLWVLDSSNNLLLSAPSLTLPAPSVGSATLDISSLDIVKVGFYVTISTTNHPLGGLSDQYHVSLRATEGAELVTPEPTSLAIWGLGMGALGFVGYKRRKRGAG